MRRTIVVAVAVAVAGLATAGPALACGGLIGPNGAVNLVRTTTLAAWHDGVEHYVTAFSFAGGSGEFGSIIPLPAIPTNVERGGDWTLQRLQRETAPKFAAQADGAATTAAGAPAEVILETKIDALDVTVLKGGATAIGDWARDHGFRLPADAPEVLDWYAKRSPIFLAARFDADAAKARGQQIGDGTPVHITMPLASPWVPLRILALGKEANDVVQADVYLLTDEKPAMLPNPLISHRGLSVERFEDANASLLTDLRTDKGMEWVPAHMWFTHLVIDGAAEQIHYDLATSLVKDVPPSSVAAGLANPAPAPAGGSGSTAMVVVIVLGVALAGGAVGLGLLIRRMAG